MTETHVELEGEENRESREWRVYRSAKGGVTSRYHNTKIDKFIKQEQSVTRPGCIV